MKKTIIAKLAAITVMVLGSVGIVGGGFWLSRSFHSHGRPQISSSIAEYRKIRHQLWLNPEEISHFPVDIPPQAQVKGFIYSPTSATGGSALQLRLQQPQGKIQTLLSHYRQVAKAKYYGGNTNEHTNRDRGLPTTFFYTSDNREDNNFPASYEILVLNAQDEGMEGFAWSQGNSSGVAINPRTSEVVYWAETW